MSAKKTPLLAAVAAVSVFKYLTILEDRQRVLPELERSSLKSMISTR